MPLPGIGEGLFTQSKNTIIGAFLALPIVLVTISGFFATTTANVGMMILFLGQILGVPVVQFGTTFLRGFSFLQNMLGLGPALTYANFNHSCSLSPVDVKNDQLVPPISYWLAHVIFFATYVTSNAFTLFYTDPETQQPDPLKVENRKAQALTAFILCIAIFVPIIVIHYRYVGCDTPGSLFLGLALYVPMGYGFFRLAEVCGLRTADLFGIATKLFLPAPGDNVYPYACVNIKPT